MIKVLIKFRTIKYLALFLFFCIAGCEQNKKAQYTTIEPLCLSSQSTCLINATSGDFSVLFNVSSVITENEFDITLVSHSDIQINKVSAHMEGKNMFMGKIPLFFEPQPLLELESQRIKNNKAKKFIAKTMLGSCSEENMRWVIWFDISIFQANDKISNEKFIVEFDSQRAY